MVPCLLVDEFGFEYEQVIMKTETGIQEIHISRGPLSIIDRVFLRTKGQHMHSPYHDPPERLFCYRTPHPALVVGQPGRSSEPKRSRTMRRQSGSSEP